MVLARGAVMATLARSVAGLYNSIGLPEETRPPPALFQTLSSARERSGGWYV
jgi:hypothetical protein